MSGFPHRIARWLRLGLTSLALVVGAMPAHALPAAQAVVTLSVERREAAEQESAAEASAPSRHLWGQAPQFPSRAPSVGRVPETRSPGPPRRLFIAHRALLR